MEKKNKNVGTESVSTGPPKEGVEEKEGKLGEKKKGKERQDEEEEERETCPTKKTK